MASPVNDPLTPVAVAFVAAGAGAVVVVDEVLDEDDVPEEVPVEVLFLLVVAAGFLDEVVAGFFVATAAALSVTTGVSVTTAAVFSAAPGIEVAAEAPASVESPLSPNCGGVTDKTAPRPPTVPPAISNARFMPITSSSLFP